MKLLNLVLAAGLLICANSVSAQKNCTTKEKVECPAGADIHNASDVHERCTKSYERECNNSGGRDNCGSGSGNSGSNRSDREGRKEMSRAADNGSKKN